MAFNKDKFKSNIKTHKKRVGFSTDNQLAAAARISEVELKAFLEGKKEPNQAQLDSLASALKVTPSALTR